MSKARVHPAVWVSCLMLLTAAGTWGLQRHLAGAGAEAAAPDRPTEGNSDEPAAAVLADLPPAGGRSASDRAVTGATGRVQRNEADEAAWADLGDALMQKARETADADYYRHAERAYRKALALNPKNLDATTGLAWVYGGRHEFELSIQSAEKAVALDPNSSLAYGLLGDAAVELGDYDAAFEHYQKMLDLRPDLSSYSRGAVLLAQTGNVRKAGWLLDKALKVGGPYAENTIWCRAQRALLYFNQGGLVPADQLLQDALQTAPSNYHLLAAMGKVKTARKDYPAAIECYKKALAVAPHHEALAELGDVYHLTGAKAEAEKQYQLVETIHALNKSKGVRGDIQLAQFYADHDRHLPEALRMAEEEFKTRKNVYAADTLAWCLYKNHRFKEAQRAVLKALRRHTPEARFLFHAGMIDAKLGDRPSAQKYLYQALSLNPNFSPIFAPQAAATLQELGSRPPESEPRN